MCTICTELGQSPHKRGAGRSDLDTGAGRIAVIVPCYNEAGTIGPLVRAITLALPSARVIVMDNASDDATAATAAANGAEVMHAPRRGKGNAIRSAFCDIEADIYVMMDGDGTYAPAEAPGLIRALVANRLDMVIGARKGVSEDAGRFGHAAGNRIFNLLYARMFGRSFNDIFSGYRVFSRRFVKSFPALSSGFEIETEMSVHAQMLRLAVKEVPVSYGRRPEGSQSKLSTHRDGVRILGIFLLLMKEVKPFAFFSAIGLASLGLSLATGLPIIIEFLETGLVERLPTWFLAVTFGLMAVIMFFCGIILDSIARGRLEQKMLVYRGIPNFQPGASANAIATHAIAGGVVEESLWQGVDEHPAGGEQTAKDPFPLPRRLAMAGAVISSGRTSP